MPYPMAGYQYSAKAKGAQKPKSCTGTGVTAGSTPGAAVCAIRECSGTCDSSSNSRPTNVLFEDTAHSVYSPIGMIPGDTGSKDWHAMFEHFIKDELVQHGPIAAAFDVDADFQSFFDKSPKGIRTVTATQTIKVHGGHAVAIVGYGVEAGQKYWLIRNSWGRSWADSGFFRYEIGGGASSRLGFATNKHGLWAMSTVMQTGGNFRRMGSYDEEGKEARRLAVVTRNSTALSAASAGGSSACSAHHAAEVAGLRTWFLKDKTNYKGVSTSCAVPWTYESSGECKASIIHGLLIKTTLHVKDCNGKKYHMTVRLTQKSSISTAQVLHNSGPEETKNDAPETASDGGASEYTKDVGTTSNTWRAAAGFLATFSVIAQIIM